MMSMHRRTACAASIALTGVVVASAWLWIGPGSYQPCRPAPPWDDLAIWISGSLGAGETDGPIGAYCNIPTDTTWLVAIEILLLAIALSVYAIVSGRNLDTRRHV